MAEDNTVKTSLIFNAPKQSIFQVFNYDLYIDKLGFIKEKLSSISRLTLHLWDDKKVFKIKLFMQFREKKLQKVQ